MTDQKRKAMGMALEALKAWLIADVTKLPILIPQTENAVFVLSQALNVDAIDTSSTYVDENEKREHEPVAWRWLYNGKPDSHKCFDGKGPDADVILQAASSVMPRTVQYFYTAPPSKPDDLLRQSEQEGWRWAKECEAEVKRLKECLFQMQNAAADLSKKNQKLVEALEGLDEAYCRAGSPLNKQERHEDRMRLIVARRVIAKHKEQA